VRGALGRCAWYAAGCVLCGAASCFSCGELGRLSCGACADTDVRENCADTLDLKYECVCAGGWSCWRRVSREVDHVVYGNT
jgi:hypothetical protein